LVDSTTFFITTAVTLLVIVDPLGLVPVYISLMRGTSVALRRRTAMLAPCIGGAILIATLLAGEWILRTLSISLPAFRIAGGLLLFFIAIEMVFGKRMEEQARTARSAADEQPHDVAAFPLGIPLIAGPGAVTAMVLLSGQAGPQPILLFLAMAAVVLVMIACFAAFHASEYVGRFLGVTGTLVTCRLLGLILASLAVQFVIDGVLAVKAS
jgi:multiple antibiotic resistance protein